VIKVHNTVNIVEIDGKECGGLDPTLAVHSHWNRDQLVVLELDGKRVTVSAGDMLAAIANATNTRRHA
jgi:hypothetical protein